MSDNYIKNVVEAALLAAGRPLQLNELALLFDENTRPEPAAIRAALAALEADYGSRGIEVKETASGFRIQVRKEMANEVSRLWPERPPKYSRALLETLALIAYRQPITRGEIEAVRGVAVNPNIIKTVIERNWVHVVGTRDVPGRPELLGTTKDFLDYFGLRALDELPPLAELKAMGDVNLQLDLAKPADGSEDGGSSGSGGSSGADEGGNASGTPGDSSVAAAGAAAAVAVAAAATAVEASEAATEARVPLPSEELVAYEHDPRAATLAHVEVESDPGDVTVEVEALTFVEQQLEAEARAPEVSIETGEFEMSELGLSARQAPAIETEFEVDDIGSAQADEDDAADDEEELSAAPQSSTELVAAPPRDRDD